jgi:hypothetical protein
VRYLGTSVHLGGWAAAPPARITTTAGVINNELGDARIGDRTRRISLVMRMPAGLQTIAGASEGICTRSNADTANDGGANAVVTRRSPRGTARSRAGRDSDAKGRGPRCVRDQVTVQCPGRLTNDYLRAV